MSSVVGLDFDKQLLTLSPAIDFAAPAGANEVKLKRQGTLHFLPISVDGQKPVEAALDLGNGGALSLSKEYHESVPALAKLPILGTLFRSRDFQRNATELVIIATPYLVRPVEWPQLQGLIARARSRA